MTKVQHPSLNQPPRVKPLHKRLFLLATALVFAVLSGACVTTGMWQKKTFNTQNYTESVSGFLASKDGKHLVVLGVARHYVFEYKRPLSRLLNSPLAPKLSAEFKPFILRTDTAEVSGSFQLKVDAAQLNPQELMLAKEYGLYKSNLGKGKAIYLSSQRLKGKYYTAGNFELPSSMRRLNQTYTVTIRQLTPTNRTALKALATPITVAADGVLLLVGVPLVMLSYVTD